MQTAAIVTEVVVVGVQPEIGALGLEGLPVPSRELPQKYGGTPPQLE